MKKWFLLSVFLFFTLSTVIPAQTPQASPAALRFNAKNVRDSLKQISLV